MTDFPSFDDQTAGGQRIVYVREIRTADLPEEIQAQTRGRDTLYAIHSANGEVLALVSDRAQAFVVARQNEFAPMSVH
ncbi:DUF1150 family protein [soil metagenome]